MHTYINTLSGVLFQFSFQNSYIFTLHYPSCQLNIEILINYYKKEDTRFLAVVRKSLVSLSIQNLICE